MVNAQEGKALQVVAIKSIADRQMRSTTSSFNDVDDRDARFVASTKRQTLNELTLERREEALAHRVVSG